MGNFCRVPLGVTGGRGAGLRQWPMGHEVTWTVVASIPGFDSGSSKEICHGALDLWKAASGFEHRFVANPRSANLLVGNRPIDASGGVLAEAELPNVRQSSSGQLRLWFDSNDSWTTSTDWEGTGRFPVQVVGLHEFGHSIGIGHEANGITDAIMDPQISQLRDLQPWDIREAVLRYGEEAVPADPDAPNDDLLLTIARCLDRLTESELATIKGLFGDN